MPGHGGANRRGGNSNKEGNPGVAFLSCRFGSIDWLRLGGVALVLGVYTRLAFLERARGFSFLPSFLPFPCESTGFLLRPSLFLSPFSAGVCERRRRRRRSGERDGEGEEGDTADRERGGEAGDLLQAQEGAVQEGRGAGGAMRRRRRAHRLLRHRQALAVRELQARTRSRLLTTFLPSDLSHLLFSIRSFFSIAVVFR